MPKEHMVGIQLGPASVYDEGTDTCLDIISNEGGVNTLFVYAENFYGAHNRPITAFADHGMPIKDERTRSLTKIWARRDESYIKETMLKPQISDDAEFAGCDVFDKLKEPCEKKCIDIYARILGFYGADHNTTMLSNFPKLLGTDPFGVTGRHVCFRSPDFINYYTSTVESLLKTHPYIKGLQFGFEIGSMLNRLLRNGWSSVCFCDKCRREAKSLGIDSEKAAKGWRELTLWSEDIRSGVKPLDGVMVTFFRILLKYPQILTWEKFQMSGITNIYKKVYGTAKAVNPSIDFGIHIDHQQSSWDPWFRALVDYREMSEYCDFIKPILYHQVISPRVRRWYYDEIAKTWMNEISPQMFMDLYSAVNGYDESAVPKAKDMDVSEFGCQYVYREIKRIKDATGDNARAVAGIGIDVLYNNEPHNPNPNSVKDAIKSAAEAGGEGILLSREYGEMKIPTLNKARDTFKEMGWI